MIELVVHLNGDGAWPDLLDRGVIHLGDGAPPMQIAGLAHGMKSGAPSVSMRLDLPDGHVVIAETSFRLFFLATAAIVARLGDGLAVDEDLSRVGRSLDRWTEILKSLQGGSLEDWDPKQDLQSLEELVSFAREWHTGLSGVIGGA